MGTCSLAHAWLYFVFISTICPAAWAAYSLTFRGDFERVKQRPQRCQESPAAVGGNARVTDNSDKLRSAGQALLGIVTTWALYRGSGVLQPN